MVLNSCLYETRIMHHRLTPREHHFTYTFFSFYLDIAELDTISTRVPIFARNRFNLYAFYDADHMGKHATVRANIEAYIKDKGIEVPAGRIMLLTFVRTLGYIFNPVSFYFCFDRNDKPLCVVPEIGNTFGEIKAFMLDIPVGENFNGTIDKFYYISPFTKLDDQLDFKLTIPEDRLNIGIDTSKGGQKIVLTSMTGRKLPLTTWNLLALTARVPFVTFKAIALIHWHALLLWLKKVPFEEKTSNPDLQKEVERAWCSSEKLKDKTYA